MTQLEEKERKSYAKIIKMISREGRENQVEIFLSMCARKEQELGKKECVEKIGRKEERKVKGSSIKEKVMKLNIEYMKGKI